MVTAHERATVKLGQLKVLTSCSIARGRLSARSSMTGMLTPIGWIPEDFILTPKGWVRLRMNELAPLVSPEVRRATEELADRYHDTLVRLASE